VLGYVGVVWVLAVVLQRVNWRYYAMSLKRDAQQLVTVRPGRGRCLLSYYPAST